MPFKVAPASVTFRPHGGGGGVVYDPFLIAAQSQLLLKVVQVHPLQFNGADGGDADSVVDHELRQSLPADKNDLVLHVSGILHRSLADSSVRLFELEINPDYLSSTHRSVGLVKLDPLACHFWQ